MIANIVTETIFSTSYWLGLVSGVVLSPLAYAGVKWVGKKIKKS